MSLHVPEKLALTLCFLVASFTAPPILSLGLVGVILASRLVVPGLRPVDKVTARRFRKVLTFLFCGALVMTLLNGALMQEGAIRFQWGGISFFDNGLLFGFRTGARLLLMTSGLLMLFGSTPLSEITAFLNSMGLPASIVMTIHLTVHFVSSMPSRIERIYSAQEARGAPVRSNIISRMLSLTAILSPLVLSSTVESIERGKALELRGYTRASRGTDHAIPPQVSFLTLFFLLLSIITLALPWLLG
ncbi:MAG: energy-coupling factor transporter transmembrane component T [Bacteroidota bacterium]